MNKTANTFQIAFTDDGEALELTTNGTGKLFAVGDGTPTFSDTLKDVAFTEATNLVTEVAHGLQNGEMVCFQKVKDAKGILPFKAFLS